MRFIITKRGCPSCIEAKKVINRINLRLPEEKRFQIMDNYLEEEFGISDLNIIQRIDLNLFQEYPFIYIDGIVVQPAIKELLYAYLVKFLSEDFIVRKI